jgi:hypothetical protein
MRTPSFTALVFWVAIAIGQESQPEVKTDETWSCWESYDTKRKELVRLTVFRDSGIGGLVVAGSRQIADFEVQGFNRRRNFDFSEEEKIHRFAFIIEPVGDGLYYDFSSGGKTACASQSYQCGEIFYWTVLVPPWGCVSRLVCS